MNLDFDTIEIPEEKLNRTIQNNIKKVHGIHRKQMIRHTAGLFCAAAFFFCLSAIFLHSNPSLAADLFRRRRAGARYRDSKKRGKIRQTFTRLSFHRFSRNGQNLLCQNSRKSGQL